MLLGVAASLGALALLVGGPPLGRCGSASLPAVAAGPAPGPPPPAPPPGAAPAAQPQEEVAEPIRRYLEATQYPPTSGRLTEDHVSLLEPNRRYERPRPIPATLGGPPEEVVSLLLTADRYFYTDRDVARLRLEASRQGEPVELAVLDAHAVREGRTGPEGAPEALAFRHEEDGLAADLPLAVFSDHHGPVLVRVRVGYGESGTHQESLRLFVTPQGRVPARFTGEFRDEVHAGSLRLHVGIDVEVAGFYRIDANLHAAGAPVAFAAFKGELSQSDRFATLEVFGKVLRDAGRPGPYVVDQLRGYRFREGEYPDRERLPDPSPRFTTRAWPLTAFSDAVWTSPHKQRMVELMQQDLERGISLDVPPRPLGPGAGEGQAPPPGLPAPHQPSKKPPSNQSQSR